MLPVNIIVSVFLSFNDLLDYPLIFLHLNCNQDKEHILLKFCLCYISVKLLSCQHFYYDYETSYFFYF